MNIRQRPFLLAITLLIATALVAQDSPSVGKLPFEQLQKLADSGDPAAQNELGMRYRLGSDVEKDPAKAIPWFLKAARQGYGKAYFNLGAAYYNGDGVPVNSQNSCAYFIFAADTGDARGTEALTRTRSEMSVNEMNRCEEIVATAYLNGAIVKQDYARAVSWFKTACDSGEGAACGKLSQLYDQGIGVSTNKAESVKWLQRAADLKYPPALYQLGKAYETGNGFPSDSNMAKKLYEQASYAGVTQAFAALGAIYAEGRGVKPDQQKALAYYLVAANNGIEEANTKVNELSAHLSAKQIAASRQEAAKLSAFTRGPLILVRK